MSKKKVLISVIIFTIIAVILLFVFNLNHRYNKLSISKSKWDNIIESRTENKNLVLEDIKFNDYKLIVDEKTSTIYYSVINNSKNKYNPRIEYTTNKKSKLAILSDDITDEKVKNNYQFKIIIYNEKEFHIYNLKCTDIPVLNITYNKNEENMRKNISMEMYLFDNLSNIPNKITISNGRIKVNENNYIFSLHMLTPGKNERESKRSILNMNPNSEYLLTPVDNEKEIDVEKNHRVELFINNEYKGVYYLEHMLDETNKLDTHKVSSLFI